MGLPIPAYAQSRSVPVQNVCKFLVPNVSLNPALFELSVRLEDTAKHVIANIPEDSAELVVGLRKLLEAKDAIVRAALDASQ